MPRTKTAKTSAKDPSNSSKKPSSLQHTPAEMYERAKALYLEKGYHPVVVAEELGINTRTAQKYWHTGLRSEGLPPIRVAVEREQIAARAKIQQERVAAAEEKRLAALKQAEEARAQEGRMIEIARGTTLQGAAVAANLALGARRLSEVLNAKLQALASNPESLDIAEGARLLNSISRTTAQITSAAHELMQMERLHLGEPTHIIEVAKQDLSIPEIEARVEAAARALARVREHPIHSDAIDTTGEGAPFGALAGAPHSPRLRIGTRVS